MVVLPAPFRPEEPEYFAGVDFEIDAFDGLEAAVAFRQGFYSDERLFWHRSWTWESER